MSTLSQVQELEEKVVNVRQGQYLIADAWAGVGLLYGLASVL